MNKKWLAAPYSLWIVGFTVIPLLFIGYYALTDGDGGFTLANLAQIGNSAHYIPLLRSLILAAVCTVVCLLIAYPLALILSDRTRGKGNWVIFLFILPMWMNFLLRINAMRLMINYPHGYINNLLNWLGLPGFDIVSGENAIIAVAIGMIYDYLPFMILPVYNAVSNIDRSLFESSHDLGAGRFRTLANVVLPLSLPGIISGITMVFIPAISDFAISSYMGGNNVNLIGTVVYNEFFALGGSRNVGSALSLILMLFVLLSLLPTLGSKRGGDRA